MNREKYKNGTGKVIGAELNKKSEKIIYYYYTLQKHINQQIVNVNCTYIKGRCVRRMMLFSKADDRPEWLEETYFGAPKPDRER